MEIKRESTYAAITPACAYNSNSSTSNEFEVFLSFRGPDTRLTFADCLYHFLDKAGIRVFRDDEEIRKGERIEGGLLRAIETSKIYVPIFSENYASSAWCLRELTHMVECLSRAKDKVILPIFCGVKTDDVKLKTRLYLDALDKHEEEGRFEGKRWKNALIEAARFNGWDLQDNGFGEVSTAVLDEVSTRLNKRRRNLPDDLVGIHDHVQTILNLLNEGPRPHDVQYLVIHGMGGIGKTTLASAVYNHIFDQFQVRSFLTDVRESAENKRIFDLQKKLLSELCQGRSLEICDSVDEGINIIRERFCDKKVLLILDDVNKLDQLSKLAGKSDWFGPGSKIIITTRDINFLPIKEENVGSCFQADFGEVKIYEMREMDSSYALQLFSKHAFKMNFPPCDFYDISREITSKAGGLPLALEVIGSSLYCESKKSWKKTLKKLHFVPKEEVLNRLEISYDILKPHQKEMFLDIACFFIGKERVSPYYMWKASKYIQASEIHVLACTSMIKIKENDTLWMHDLLRDLGREIVDREDKNLPGNRSRLWEPETAFKVVRMKEGTDKVVALRLSGLYKEHNFTSEQFSKLPNLRFLELEGGNLVGNFENLLSKLTWLSWSDCPSELSATNLCLENLVVLELSGSNITEDWNGWGPCLVSENLKVIHITQCPSLRRTPDFSKCLNLKKLVIQGCTSMVVVDGPQSKLGDLKLTNSVGGIESLLQVDFNATGITELLASNWNSKKYLDESEPRELPKAIGMLENNHLKAQAWGDMKGEIPSELDVKKQIFLDWTSNFTGKEGFDLYSVRKASDVPISGVPLRYKSLIDKWVWALYELRRLAKLLIRYEDKNFSRKRGSLGVLRIPFSLVLPMKEGSDEVVALRPTGLFKEQNSMSEQFPNLRDLRFLDSQRWNSVRTLENLLSLPSWSECFSLKELVFHDCTSTVVVDSSHSKLGDLKLTNPVGGIESSLHLDLGGTSITELLASNEKLDENEIREPPKATGMLEKQELTAQFWVDMDEELPRESEVPSFLQTICRLLTAECGFSPLHRLQFKGRVEVIMLPELPVGFKKLPKSSSFLLNIFVYDRFLLPPFKIGPFYLRSDERGEVQNIVGPFLDLESLPSSFLNIVMDYLLMQPPIKHGLSYLQKLRLDQCDSLVRFPELPAGLKELTFSSHLLWTALDLSYLTHLVDLQIRRNTLQSSVFRREAPKIEWIEQLSHLERLTIDMGDVQCPRINWASLSRLRSSVIIHWHNVLYIRGVVRDSELLERISISRLQGIHQLSVFTCPGLIKTKGVEKLKSLDALFIHRCSSLERMPDLSKCRKLRQLNLAHCPLQNLPDLHLPEKCHLMIEGCEISSAFDGDHKDGRMLCHSVDHINIQL